MSIQLFIAITGAFMTFTLAMLAGVWHFASIAAGFRSDAKSLKEELHEFKLKTVSIDKIPEHERRIGILEGVTSSISGEHSTMKLTLALMHREMQSIAPPKPRHPSHHEGQ